MGPAWPRSLVCLLLLTLTKNNKTCNLKAVEKKISAQQVADNIHKPIQGSTTLDFELEKLFALLSNGPYYPWLMEAVIVVGIFGAGQSSLVHVLAGNNDDIEGIYDATAKGYVIKDIITGLNVPDSQQIYPKLFVESITKLAMYDAPTFQDNKTMIHDIAASYFVNKLTQFINTTKLILCIEYQSLKPGSSNVRIKQLLDFTVSFLKNMDHFQNSFMLVVTNVENKLDRNGNLVADEIIIKEIEQVLLKSKSTTMHRKVFFSRKTYSTYGRVIDILIQNKITIMRQIMTAGVISDNAVVQTGKQKILKNLYALKPTDLENTVIKYSPSEKTKEKIKILQTQTHEIVHSLMKSAMKFIENIYITKFEIFSTIEEMPKKMNQTKKNFHSNRRFLVDATSASEWVHVLKMKFAPFDYNVPLHFVFEISSYESFLNFFDSVVGPNNTLDKREWLATYDSILNRTVYYLKWYEFLLALFRFLSIPKMIFNKHLYNVKNIAMDWGKGPIHGKGIEIVNENFETFYKKVEKNVFGFITLTESPLKPKQLVEINLVLETTIIDRPKFYCNSTSVTIVANFLFLNMNQIINACSKDKFPDNAKIHIFATFFIVMTSSISNDFTSLVIIAPNVTLKGDIYSQGKDGPGKPESKGEPKDICDYGWLDYIKHFSEFFWYTLKWLLLDAAAEYLTHHHRTKLCNVGNEGDKTDNTSDGMQAGSIIVIADIFQASDITIKTVGGRGGPGQWGQTVRTSTSRSFAWPITPLVLHPQIGSIGGHGGVGGHGGLPGFVGTYSSNNPRGLTIHSEKGQNGDIGLSGWGSLSCYRTDKRQLNCFLSDENDMECRFCKGKQVSREDALDFYKGKAISYCYVEHNKSADISRDGKPSERTWAPAPYIESDNIFTVKLAYLKHSISHMTSCNADSLFRFWKTMENNTDIKGTNDTINYVRQMLFLNDLSLKLNETVEFPSDFMRSLYDLVEQDLETFLNDTVLKKQNIHCLRECQYDFNGNCNAKEVCPDIAYTRGTRGEYCFSNFTEDRSTLTDATRKALLALKTLTVGQAQLTRDIQENGLSININSNLETSKAAIEEYKLHLKSEKLLEITNEYKQELKEKIKHGKSLLKNNLNPRVQSLKVSMNHQMRLILNEIEDQINMGEDLKANKLKLYLTAIGGAVIDAIDAIMKVADLAGSHAAELKMVLEQGRTWTKILLNPEEQAKRLAQLTKSLKIHIHALAKSHNEIESSKTSLILKTLDSLTILLGKLPQERFKDKIAAFTEKITQYKNLTKATVKNYDLLNQVVLTIINYIDNIRQKVFLVPSKTKSIKRPFFWFSSPTYSKKVTEVETTLKQITGNGVILLGAIQGVEISFDGNTDQNHLNDVVASLDKRLEGLKKLRNSLYNVVAPFINDVMDGYNRFVDGESQDYSLIYLDYSRYTLKESFGTIRILMAGYTDFTGNTEVKSILESLEVALSTAMDIQERIANYNEQQRHADFMLALTSDKVAGIIIPPNTDLFQAYKDLQEGVRKNRILWIYKKSLQSLLHFVFPYGGRWGKALEPIDLVDKDLLTYVSEIHKQISRIQLELLRHQSEIREGAGGDTNRIYKTFAEKKNHRPFYVWKFKDFKNETLSLLSGLNVPFICKVFDSVVEWEAIKFKVIHLVLRLRSSNKTLLKEFKDTLNSFKARLTHSGVSHFRASDKYYTFSHSKVQITHAFEFKNGSPVSYNGNYIKLRNGDLMLSPYTMWNLQIVPDIDGSLEMLEPFMKYTIDVLLEGEGSYVEGQTIVAEDELDKYYKPDETMLTLTTNADPVPKEDVWGKSFKITKIGKYVFATRTNFKRRPENLTAKLEFLFLSNNERIPVKQRLTSNLQTAYFTEDSNSVKKSTSVALRKSVDANSHISRGKTFYNSKSLLTKNHRSLNGRRFFDVI